MSRILEPLPQQLWGTAGSEEQGGIEANSPWGDRKLERRRASLRRRLRRPLDDEAMETRGGTARCLGTRPAGWILEVLPGGGREHENNFSLPPLEGPPVFHAVH